MEEYLSNVTIEKVFKGKSGTSDGKNGPFEWQMWDVYIDGKKYTYFSSGNKPIPSAGAFVKMLKYEVTQTPGKGKHEGKTFTNYNIKEMALDNLEKQNNEPRQEPDQRPPDDYEPPGEKDGYADKPTTVKSSAVRTGDEKASFYVSYAKDLMCSLVDKGEYPEGVTLKELAKQVMDVGLWMQKTANGEDIPF